MTEDQKTRMQALGEKIRAEYPYGDALLICLALHDMHKSLLGVIAQQDRPLGLVQALRYAEPVADLEGSTIATMAELCKIPANDFFEQMEQIRLRFNALRAEFAAEAKPDEPVSPEQAARNMKLN